ncbi:hypothetical protein H5410_003642 [Solanum commersonii]|uniref:Endonuclease/exonuclease/phosphatase domain-containing protein n=1 Tax=Solanum commersonii TaxID=4109 RepID=A0A9J6B578_SOLCO|nr:hypothetical protein H5410_003642 [Solanum commersonii]
MTPGTPRNSTALDNICTQECTPQRLEENNSSLISIEEAVPLNQKNLEEEDDPEFDMPIWIHQNILKFAKDFGVDIKGCKEEATMLFIKIDSMRQIRGRKLLNCSSQRGKITEELGMWQHFQKQWNKNWKADIYCFQETKIEGENGSLVKYLWANRWVKYCQLEASGTRGGILIMWDGRVWSGEVSSLGAYSITCKLTGINQDLIWFLTGIYAPNSREKREEVWWEVGSARGLFDGPWVVCGDFNTARFPSEKKNCSRISRAMTDLSDFIEDMGLLDPHLVGGKYTWRKGDRHDTASRLDRFLLSDEWDEVFRNIKQTLLQKITSDHNPIMLQKGFLDRVKEWWSSIVCEGRPDFILAFKLKALKDKLREWSKTSQGNLASQKQSVLNQIAELEEVQDQRALHEDEIQLKADLLIEFENLAKFEEISWRQRSRVIWLKQGDKNTKFFHKTANSHWRYNNIDELNVDGEAIKDPEQHHHSHWSSRNLQQRYPEKMGGPFRRGKDPKSDCCLQVGTCQWGSSVGVFELCDHRFLFNFPTSILAEYTVICDWKWEQKKLHLSWWSPYPIVFQRCASIPALGYECWETEERGKSPFLGKDLGLGYDESEDLDLSREVFKFKNLTCEGARGETSKGKSVKFVKRAIEARIRPSSSGYIVAKNLHRGTHTDLRPDAEEGSISPLLENIISVTPIMSADLENQLEEQGQEEFELEPQEAETGDEDQNQRMHAMILGGNDYNVQQ